MWQFTEEIYARFTGANLLSIHTTDEEWQQTKRLFEADGVNLENYYKKELAEVKTKLLQAVPQRFIPYIENDTLNQPTLPQTVREDYLAWAQQENTAFEIAMAQTMQNIEVISPQLETKLAEVLQEGMHDAQITGLLRDDSSLHIFLNMENGFTAKARVILSFDNIIYEENSDALKINDSFLYEECHIIDGYPALRIITTNGIWTIQAKQISAQFYFRPMPYFEMIANEVLPEVSTTDFTEALQPDFAYATITNNTVLPIEQFSTKGTRLASIPNGEIISENGAVFALINNDKLALARTEQSWLEQIFTTTYEDPYAIFSEPIPAEEIATALFSDDLALSVRAWNTVYENPNGHEQSINDALVFLAEHLEGDDNLMLIMYLEHFNELGIITDNTKKKLAPFI